MARYERIPQSYAFVDEPQCATSIKLECTEPQSTIKFSFDVLSRNLFRVRFTSNEHTLPPRSSFLSQVKQTGSLEQQIETHDFKKVISVGDVVATISAESVPLVSLAFKGSPAPLHRDLPHRSYCIEGAGIAHYTAYRMGDMHVGLGEKAAPLDLSNRHCTLSATDSFGYDVYRTDPLYKCIPLLINASPQGCVGVFSTSHARGMYSIGSEMDGLWGRYKVYRQDHGGLEEYLIIGRTLKEVVRTYAEVVGLPRLVPRWSFGYIAGGMKYSMLDDPPASQALMDFANKLIEHDIPCSAFQMSSGYTIAEVEPRTRNVFTWNRHRFPDPKGFVEAYHARGIKIIANVKPYLLRNHPEYKKLAAAKALFIDPRTKQTAITRLWSAGGGESGEGSHIDFTSAAGFRWWYDGVRALKELGIDVPWNDNNEYTIPNDNWQCKLDEPSMEINADANVRRDVGFWGRAIHTELMGKASHDALLAVAPNERPFVLTRSATAGTMRYCGSTWSGDNYTSWKGMRGANALSINAGICLLQCYGHDIGGFEGPQPSPELLLRWVQTGCHSTRFAINCFKTTSNDNKVGDVIEPWMYPEITPLIRKAIKRRYEMIPYLYSLHLESHLFASPPQRWVGWGYETDPEVWTEELKNGDTQYWLGDSLIVGGVYEPGVDFAKVYLPRSGPDDPGYVNLNAPYQHFSAGQWVQVASPWKDTIPRFAKVGAAIPIGKSEQTFSPGEKENLGQLPADDYRAIEIFPRQESAESDYASSARAKNAMMSETSWYEDDGLSASPSISKFTMSYKSQSETGIQVSYREDLSSGYVPQWTQLVVVLPAGFQPSVALEFAGGEQIAFVGKDDRNRQTFQIKINR